ncbi:short chain dehydrogenase [Microlunatus speluncae]|uniref:short chain dehydrogenase n=1 Tax=Microlunatus speluncae TaxID=2594267 RepID=UPI00126682ED|nr:short chain dehydrogenase [Microlunatus speluncae]
MRIVVVGANGTLGAAVAADLGAEHEVVGVSRRTEPGVDLEDPASLDALFRAVPGAGAVVCCAASGPLLDLMGAGDAEFAAGLRGKLLGQVALARRAFAELPDGGSVTLTGGTFAEPLPGGSLGALVNAGLEGFVTNAAAELPRGLRLNLIAPGWIRESLVAAGLDTAGGTPAADVARHFRSCVEGDHNGRVIRA